MRACCDRVASQVVQLVDYAALDRRRNFKEEIAISERPDSFDGTHCAAVPTALRIASKMNGESFEIGWSLSTDWTTNHLS